jgi:hypothetical protein
MQFQIGERVVCNGNKESIVIARDYWNCSNLWMITIRLWDGFRHVGDVQMSERALLKQQEQ